MAVAVVLPGQLADVGGQPGFIVSVLRDIALPRAMLAERRTGDARKPTALRERAQCRRGDARGSVVSPGPLLEFSLSRVRSDTARRSRAFTVSSSLAA